MPCNLPYPTYNPLTQRGIKLVNSNGDGYSIDLSWYKAYPTTSAYSVAYNIYYSSNQDTLLSEGPKFISLDNTTMATTLLDFIPGELYYFLVRATEFDYNVDPNLLSPSDNQWDGYLRIYPETILLADITDDDMLIPIADIDIFPSYGVIQVGYELISYGGKDIPYSNLVALERGFAGTNARLHTTDGYDGYNYLDPIIKFWKGYEENNTFIIQEENTFNPNNEVYTLADGYKHYDRVGQLTSDIGTEESERIDFPRYDFVGWHRTNPADILKGKCLDSYIGGEYNCADGYNGISTQVRGIPVIDIIDQRQEVLLDQTGSRCVLLRRVWNGIVDNAYEPNMEYPDHRSPYAFGTQMKTGYEQYMNPRRSDRNILVRFEPTSEDLKMEDNGLQMQTVFNCWTLSTPLVRDRDVIIRLNTDGSEEFRYEILDVSRGNTYYGHTGVQKFRAQRIVKTDPVYQWRAAYDLGLYPTEITTTVGLIRGPGGVSIPHTHKVTINENGSLVLYPQTTGYSDVQRHNHPINPNGVIQEILGHRHDIII